MKKRRHAAGALSCYEPVSGCSGLDEYQRHAMQRRVPHDGRAQLLGDEPDRQHRVPRCLDIGCHVGVAVDAETLAVRHGIRVADVQDEGLCAQDDGDRVGLGVPLDPAAQSLDDGREGDERAAPLDLGARVLFALEAVDLDGVRADDHDDDYRLGAGDTIHVAGDSIHVTGDSIHVAGDSMHVVRGTLCPDDCRRDDHRQCQHQHCQHGGDNLVELPHHSSLERSFAPMSKKITRFSHSQEVN